jgi:hypothetical protein
LKIILIVLFLILFQIREKIGIEKVIEKIRKNLIKNNLNKKNILNLRKNLCILKIQIQSRSLLICFFYKKYI